MNELIFHDTYDNDREIPIPQDLFMQISKRSYDKGVIRGYIGGVAHLALCIVAAAIGDKIANSGRRDTPRQVYESYPVKKKE